MRRQFHIQRSRRGRLHPHVLKEFLYVEVCRLKYRRHFPVRRKNVRVGAKIFPDERNRDIAAGVFRLALVELDLADLERLAFGLGDCLKIHFLAPQKNRRDIQTLRRISRVRACLQRTRAAVATVIQSKSQLSRILKSGRVAVALPFDHKRTA